MTNWERRKLDIDEGEEVKEDVMKGWTLYYFRLSLFSVISNKELKRKQILGIICCKIFLTLESVKAGSYRNHDSPDQRM